MTRRTKGNETREATRGAQGKIREKRKMKRVKLFNYLVKEKMSKEMRINKKERKKESLFNI